MTSEPNPHFESAPTWGAVGAQLAFRPVPPSYTAGFALQSLRVHVADHLLHRLAVADRTLEAHYGGFVLSEARRTPDEARRLALDVSYGRDARAERIADHDARIYELGAEPAPDDIDGRPPSVVAWHDAEMFYLIASNTLPAERLILIARSLYD